MSDLNDSQQARLFDALLSDADRWNTAPSAQARRAAETDATVADDLALVAALRNLTPPRAETEAVRARIGMRLAQVMHAEPARPAAGRLSSARAWLRAVTAPPARTPRRTTPKLASEGPSARRWLDGVRPGRAAALGAATLVIIGMLLTGASVASAQALPESPLYNVKRAEETLQLDFAMTDTAKGATLTLIASRRLTEAVAEADLRRETEARALLQEFNAALSQMIDLTAQAQNEHEDTRALASAVQALLTAEENSAARAKAHGELGFAAAAASGAQAAHAHIKSVGITLPRSPAQNGAGSAGQGTGAGNSKGSSSGGKGSSSGGKGSNGSPQPTVEPKPTHTPHTGNSGSSQNTPPSTTKVP
jgi:uncharacterized membrane protein YgcG